MTEDAAARRLPHYHGHLPAPSIQQHRFRGQSMLLQIRHFATATDDDDTGPSVSSSKCNDHVKAQQEALPLDMENLYQEWTLKQDQKLWENHHQSVSELASLLGRGLRGVESRLAKLNDMNSSAYQRLFVQQQQRQHRNKKKALDDDNDTNNTSKSNNKLVPASEVLRRIQWDYALTPSDFFILHYDRVQDTVVRTAMDAPNDSIAGKETHFVDALPEHRIVAIQYKERIVWDRERRLDRVFSNEGIETVMATYDAWKREKEEREAWERQRREEVTVRLQQILGLERFTALKDLSNNLRMRLRNDPALSPKVEVEKYVEAAMNIFREVREDPSVSLLPLSVPKSDMEAVDTLSELVAMLPDAQIRSLILDELATQWQQAEGTLKASDVSKVLNRPLPELDERDLTETFVRGTGPGGQKINKTSNRVVLVHEPTQLRVECQDTRNLHDNRKIARKRLREKLDDYLHGSQSKASVKSQRLSTKKSKSKARSRKRQREKQEAKKASSSGTNANDNTFPL